jgi:hypothetical protein
MSLVLFVFGSKRGLSQSSAETQASVLSALEQASTDIFQPPCPRPSLLVGLRKLA